MESMDTSGKALVEHWKLAAERGEVNANTANALRAACTQVLGVIEGWETYDIRVLDVADACRRFQNKRAKDFKSASLEAYKRRFAQAVKLFLAYSEDPSARAWVPKGRAPRKEKKPSESAPTETPTILVERAASASGLVEYPFPLRQGRLAYLRLPADLNAAEVKRLTAYLNTLAVDADTTG